MNFPKTLRETPLPWGSERLSMNVSNLEYWTLEESDESWRFVWQHEERPVFMTVSYQPDHYDDGEQVMRWHARATLGRNITFGQNHFVICDDGVSKSDAREEAVTWAINWMQEFTVEEYDIEDTLEELEDMDEYV